jgi:membrane protease YdiL (CAAX protease family)
MVSACILAPFYIFFHKAGQVVPITLNFLLTQLFVVSFPEEVFFRGFLQDVLRNDIKGVFVVSLMFMLTHLPGFILSGDPYALFTFFPSLVMGTLYMKTSNVLPSTIFHFLSNMVFLGFMI